MLRFQLLVLSLALAVSCIEIVNLPGQPTANFKQYSGYYAAGPNGHHRLHYWFMESQSKPSTDPLLLWLTGGPGCSGLSAILTEWGPFLVNPDGATLRSNPYGWNKNANILTLESPAGVGFSYATDGDNSANDNQTATETWEALKAFFTEFPQYAVNDFYVTGESYGGIYVPTLVQAILDRQSMFKINIKGFAIGNGMVNGDLDTDALVQFTHKHGLIDEALFKKAQTQCCSNGDTDDCPFHKYDSGFCGDFVNTAMMCAWGGQLNPYNLYQDCTNQGGELPKRFVLDAKRKTGKAPNVFGTVPCMDESAVTNYLNNRNVRQALGIPGLLPPWSICNDDINENYGRMYNDMTPQVNNAIAAGLRVMLYYGDVDMACNFFMGQKFANQLGQPLKAAKRPYFVQGQVAGYVTDYGALKYVTVKGAGHMVPTDKPPVAVHLLTSFLNNKTI